jgi:hypothetical protein
VRTIIILPKVHLTPSDTSYKVYKIDSINNFYLIYASKKDAHIKIISAKEYHEKCKRIQKGNYYDFELFSMLSNEEIMPGLANCVMVDSITKIYLEDSILDLKSATNIKGLCFVRKELKLIDH